ncbi:S8 family serine peptidase [Solirubrobacter taibaiensis]|nr:S8 family serine peptidase [Solirubrobacter taibaiensis]
MVLFGVLGSLLPQGARAADIIVRRDQGLTASERAELRADAGVEHERMLSLPNTEVVSVPDVDETEALAALNADPDVVAAAPNVVVRTAQTPYAANYERFYPRFWNNDADVDAAEAWDEADAEGSDVTVAVIDQPVDADHPDLLGKVAPAPENFVRSTTCTKVKPEADHGTQVAGLLAAWKNDEGVAGVAPLASVLPLPAIDNCGEGRIADVLEAFAWAGRNSVPIVVGSFVTSVLDPVDQRAGVDQLVSEYVDAYPDTLLVVAAGNEGANVDDPGMAVYPCSNDAPNVICVGMSDGNDKPSCWSNVGGASVDLFAPGEYTYGSGVLTTVHGSLGQRSGTSMSAPLVAGAAALLKGKSNTLSAALIKEALLDGVDGFGPLGAISVSGGRLNAARPLLEAGADRLLRGGAASGQFGEWKTCDPDHDQLRFGDDKCPSQVGTAANEGCPDTDKDARHDLIDNCPEVPNPGWADTDGDGIGDACDPTRFGPDTDGDGTYDLYDACPSLPGPASNRGCPEPTPTPTASPTATPVPGTPSPTPTPTPTPALQIYLKVDVTKTKAAKVRISVSRKTKVTLKIERKSGRRWKRVTATKSVTASVSVKSYTLRPIGGKKLSKGSYRVTATVGRLSKVQPFKVR